MWELKFRGEEEKNAQAFLSFEAMQNVAGGAGHDGNTKGPQTSRVPLALVSCKLPVTFSLYKREIISPFSIIGFKLINKFISSCRTCKLFLTLAHQSCICC